MGSGICSCPNDFLLGESHSYPNDFIYLGKYLRAGRVQKMPTGNDLESVIMYALPCHGPKAFER